MLDLFTPIKIKNLELRNRIVMPPMCMYSVEKKDGHVTDWHVQHYLTRAIGGAGLIIIEMTDIEPDGRITDNDLGLWEDSQIAGIKRIVDACHEKGAKVAIQIAHAGRKATDAEFPVSASAIPYAANSKTPRALSKKEILTIIDKFRQTAKRAVLAGVDAIEIHGAHGYLIHQFQSKYTNQRQDEYGQNIALFGTEVVKAVKSAIPAEMPLIMRVSAIEYVDGGYGLKESLAFSDEYKKAGVDVFNVSSGGEGPIGSSGRPGSQDAYQVPFARAFKEKMAIPVIAVGKLSDPRVANAVIGNESADLVAVGRGMLKNPYWALGAGEELRKEAPVPEQYLRGFNRNK